MKKYNITGFADEIAESFDEQLKFLNKLNVKFMEIRGVDGKNISNLTIDETKAIKEKLDLAGVRISAIGSPVGKCHVDDNFDDHFELFKHVCEIAKILETNYIRMFSFFIPNGLDKASYKEVVIERLAKMIEYAKTQNIILLHENEKEIYGENATECLEIMEKLYCDNFKCIFDFANFVQVGQNTLEAYEMLKPYIHYVHFKDAIGQTVVPAGMGEGNVQEIIEKLFANGFEGFLSLEPHLSHFTGFAELENSADDSNKSTDGKTTWWIALNSMKAILYNLG